MIREPLTRRNRSVIGTLAVLLGLAVAVTASAAPVGPSRSAAARAWMLQSTSNPAGTEISGLSSVACTSASACTAVGSSSRTLSSNTRTLAERWNGTRWHIQPIPTPTGTSDTLYGVSCASARACVTVGDAFRPRIHRDKPLIEAWNGHRWRVQPTPPARAAASLAAVSCSSPTACTAVGFTLSGRQHAIAERWNGRTWRSQALPRSTGTTMLLGVSCSRARACTAVGHRTSGNTQPLVESWNGTRWRTRAVPLPVGATVGLLDSVSCTSPAACTATGTKFSPEETLAERWNGRRWRVQPTPNPADYELSFGGMALDGVSCTSTRACTASGEYSPHGTAAYFVESWNGRTWQLDTVPHPGDFIHGALLGVACTRAHCTAVGAYTGLTRLQVTLAMTG